MAAPNINNSNNNYTDNGFVPYMSWNKLEARPRKVDYSRVLKAEIHDPLWMIARQYQMGEFKGNDTGSGIIAKSVMNHTKITSLSNRDEPMQAYNFKLTPLESIIESVEYKFSLKERLLLTQKWIRMLSTWPSFSPSLIQDIKTNSQSLILDVGKPVLPNSPTLAEEELAREKSNLFAQTHTSSFIKAVESKDEKFIDGFEIYKLCSSITPNALHTDLTNDGVTISISLTDFNQTCTDFVDWVNNMYSLDEIYEEFWNKSKLEYEADIYDDQLVRLTADNTHNGDVDWYSFEENGTGTGTPAATNDPKITEILMTENRFAGMPSSRWWEFENGRVNFGSLDGNTTDIAKIILAQFALVYQDDWFVIPYRVPVGTYSKLEGIVVTDVFGVRTYVPGHNEVYAIPPLPASQTDKKFIYKENTWKDWSWMDVSEKDNVVNKEKPTGRMLLLPSVIKRMVSEPIESITFMRDEMSNMVWALEKIVPNNLGQGADAQQVSIDYVNYLKTLINTTSVQNTSNSDAKLEYTLMNSVPENWVPFIVKHIDAITSGNPNRDVQLQRASMPRILDGYSTSLVRPRTEVLSYGLGSTIEGYYINEEEVSRAGTKIETTFQRTRWYNGKTSMWVGRNRTTGKGQGNSGLAFDTVRDKEVED